MTKNICSLLCGILFGLGLTISQMNNPDKVLAFLDITGNWDASLAFVMAGALITLATLQHFVLKSQRPIFDTEFHLPKNNTIINKSLILGAIVRTVSSTCYAEITKLGISRRGFNRIQVDS